MTAFRPMVGRQFLDELRLQYSDRSRGVLDALGRLDMQQTPLNDPQSHAEAAMRYQRLFDDPETRRILFDARQAAIFAEAGSLPPIADQLHLPFNQMYIEPTEPILVPEYLQEPGHAADWIIGWLIFDAPMHFGEQVFRGDGGENFTIPQRNAASVVVFKRDSDGRTYSDSSFVLDLVLGLSVSRSGQMRAAEDLPDGVSPQSWTYARMKGDDRRWWERLVYGMGEMAAWMLAYMTAKGVVIVDRDAYEARTRQMRRALARAKPKPQPWHVVVVKPTVVSDEEHGGGGTHGYRYDVRGHLRLGRHRRGDGTYSETIEWVQPHQRGLRHAEYIPKTYRYDRDESPKLDPPKGSDQ